MATYKKKPKEIDAEQFLSALPPATWPAGVQVNPSSSTGYSYGTLLVSGDPPNKDGFEISDTDWVVNEEGSIVRYTNDRISELYES